jgi:hypothetical protein
MGKERLTLSVWCYMGLKVLCFEGFGFEGLWAFAALFGLLFPFFFLWCSVYTPNILSHFVKTDART